MQSMKQMTRDQSRDTGMAMALLSLILFFFLGRKEFVVGATVLHVLNMIVPDLYRPVAVVWFGLSHLLGLVMSKILLSVVFFLVVTPFAIARRMMGKDSLKLRAFKGSGESIMVARNHRFAADDLKRPY